MPTISQGEVEMVLLVSKQLVAVAVHGEQAEGGVAPAVWGHRGAHHDGAIHPCLVLHLRGRGEIAQVLDSSLSLPPPLSLSLPLSLSPYQCKLIMVGVAKQVPYYCIFEPSGEI